MTDYGVTPTGFVPKPFAVVRDEVNALHRGKRGASVDTSDGSLDGNLIAIHAERESAIWDMMQAVVAAYDPDSATDDGQDGVCALTGTERRQPRSSVVVVTLAGTPATVVNAGARVRTVSTGFDFVSAVNAAPFAALAVWLTSHAYIVGDRRTNSARCYQCITAGTSAGSGGPTTTVVDITDGTVHWTYIGEGTGAIDVVMSSVIKDSIVAVAGDLTSKQTSVGGWLTAINLLDAVVGAPVQTNESLRVTREAEIADAGNGTLDATRGALLKITGVTAVSSFQNTSDTTDVNGLTPHTELHLITGGADVAIAAVLAANVSAGILTLGTTTVLVTDSQGTPQPYAFSRPVPISIYIDVTLTYNSASPSKGGYPLDGDIQVKAALSAFAQTNQVGGKDVINSSVRTAILPVFVNGVQVAGVQGVVDVSQVLFYTDVIGTPAAWIASHAYVATPGARSVVTNDDGRTYICITSGTSAGSGGPTGKNADITDGTAHWYFLERTVVIGTFEQAKFDTSRTAVHSTAAVSL